MKAEHNGTPGFYNTVICYKALEILHTQGIESAEAWINRLKLNNLYDHIEEEYLKTRKIIYIN
jgi:hypothetical protein